VLETTKWVGLILLLGYFWFHPPHVDFLWVAAHLGVVFGMALPGVPLLDVIVLALLQICTGAAKKQDSAHK